MAWMQGLARVMAGIGQFANMKEGGSTPEASAARSRASGGGGSKAPAWVNPYREAEAGAKYQHNTKMYGIAEEHGMNQLEMDELKIAAQQEANAMAMYENLQDFAGPAADEFVQNYDFSRFEGTIAGDFMAQQFQPGEETITTESTPLNWEWTPGDVPTDEQGNPNMPWKDIMAGEGQANPLTFDQQGNVQPSTESISVLPELASPMAPQNQMSPLMGLGGQTTGPTIGGIQAPAIPKPGLGAQPSLNVPAGLAGLAPTGQAPQVKPGQIIPGMPGQQLNVPAPFQAGQQPKTTMGKIISQGPPEGTPPGMGQGYWVPIPSSSSQKTQQIIKKAPAFFWSEYVAQKRLADTKLSDLNTMDKIVGTEAYRSAPPEVQQQFIDKRNAVAAQFGLPQMTPEGGWSTPTEKSKIESNKALAGQRQAGAGASKARAGLYGAKTKTENQLRYPKIAKAQEAVGTQKAQTAYTKAGVKVREMQVDTGYQRARQGWARVAEAERNNRVKTDETKWYHRQGAKDAGVKPPTPEQVNKALATVNAPADAKIAPQVKEYNRGQLQGWGINPDTGKPLAVKPGADKSTTRSLPSGYANINGKAVKVPGEKQEKGAHHPCPPGYANIGGQCVKVNRNAKPELNKNGSYKVLESTTGGQGKGSRRLMAATDEGSALDALHQILGNPNIPQAVKNAIAVLRKKGVSARQIAQAQDVQQYME